MAEAVEGPGHETVLVVEDDRDVRAYLVELLRDLNYRVLSAQDAVAALGLIQQGDIRIDLLLTDVVLPGINGRQLAEEAQKSATRSQGSVHDGLFPKRHRPPGSTRSWRCDDPKADHTRGPRGTQTIRTTMDEVVSSAVAGEPGLTAYECPNFGYVMSVLSTRRGALIHRARCHWDAGEPIIVGANERIS